MINVVMYLSGETTVRETYIAPVDVEPVSAIGLRDLMAMWNNSELREAYIENAVETAYEEGRLDSAYAAIS